MLVPNLDTPPVLPALVPRPDLDLQVQIIKCLGRKKDRFSSKRYLFDAASVLSSEGTFRTPPVPAQPCKHNVCLGEGWDWAW